VTLLPPIPSSTVSAIYAAWEEQHKNWDSVGLSMSELGSECDRALWYSHRWASEPEQLTGQRLRLFETGNIEEQRALDDLRRVPEITVVDIDHETGKQFKLYAVGGHLRGKTDGRVYGLPEAPKTWHILEIKSHNDKSFKEVVKKGVQAAKPAHYAQVQTYMHLTGLTRALYYAINKNTDELHCERVRYDAQFCLQLFARVERVITQNVAPGRIAEDPSKWPCIFCKHKAVCHREAFGRQHCRTCLRSTPIVTEGDTSAPWLCEKFGRTLSLDEQRAGCHAHLYLPDFVPGDQFDSGDDWVGYTIRDGSTWTDQEKKAPPEPEPCEVCSGSKIEFINGGHGNVIEAPCSMCQPPADCALCGAASNQNCHMSGSFRHCPRDLGRLQTKAPEQHPSRTRYWFNPQSNCVFHTIDAQEPLLIDPLCEELTAEEFAQAQAYYASLESKQ
jgi:hypothetical protein